MKIIVLASALLLSATPAIAQGSHYVRGYTTKNGTYVAPHYQTNPNSTTTDNWSTRGNVNPYTGEPGTRNPTPSYSNPYTAPRSSSSSSSPFSPAKTTTPCYFNCPN